MSLKGQRPRNEVYFYFLDFTTKPYNKTSVILIQGANMAKLIPAAERIVCARVLIQKARDLPVPPESGRNDFSYIANVKDLLRQARDMVKFISMTPSASAEIKEEVKRIYQEAEQADRDILQRPASEA